MVEFDFEFVQPSDLTGFSLGHISISGERGRCSSKGRQPSQAMMIVVALCDLLDGVRKLVTGGKRKTAFEFVGADSSFALKFQMLADGRVRISCGKDKPLGDVPVEHLCAALEKEVTRFLGSVTALPADDAACSDLKSALRDFANRAGS